MSRGKPHKVAFEADLSQKEQRILAVAQLNGDLSYKDLASLTSYPEHQVRSVLSKLMNEGVIHPYTLINVFPLGL